MATIFIRAVLLYALLIAAIRALGKRQLSQFQPYEFALSMVFADLVATPIADISTPLLHGMMPIAALIVLHTALTVACMRSDRARSFISGRPAIVVSGGIIDEGELRRLSLSVADLMEGIRECGILDPGEVEAVIVEADGSVNAFRRKECEPPSARDLGQAPVREGIALLVVMDGKAQRANLALAGKDEAWLLGLLAGEGIAPEGVLLGSLATSGQMRLQERNGRVTTINAMPPGEARW